MVETVLTRTETDRFVEDGFLHVRDVVPAEVLAAGREAIWSDLPESPDDPATWTRPVARLFPSDDRPFVAAFDNPRLHGALDQLAGEGRWQPRAHLGQFVVRFPHPLDPGDTGWHVDETFPPEGRVSEGFDFGHWRVNLFVRDRALLLLFLYSDIGLEDGPTQIRVGSHLDVPSVLHPAGAAGLPFAVATPRAAEASAARPVTLATGRAGDVYLFHPFLVHGAQPVRGDRPRLISQTPLMSKEPAGLGQRREADSPVERAIRRGLLGVAASGPG